MPPTREKKKKEDFPCENRETTSLFQILNLLIFSTSLSKKNQANNVPTKSQVHTTLPEKETSQHTRIKYNLLATKNQQLHTLKMFLRIEKQKRLENEEKVLHLIRYILTMHRVYANLIITLLANAKTVTENKNKKVVILGPFKPGFLEALKTLSAQFLKTFENFHGMQSLLEKIDAILKLKKPTTPNGNNNGHSQSDGNSCCNLQHTCKSQDQEVPCSSTSALRQHDQVSTKEVLALSNKKHGIDHLKKLVGHYCVCGNHYDKIESLKGHIRYFKAKGSMKCRFCPMAFSYPSRLQMHMRTAHKIAKVWKNTITCLICRGSFNGWKEFRSHLKKMHNITRVTAVGNATWVSPMWKNTAEHETVDFRTPFTCSCGHTFTSRHALTYHIESNMSRQVFKCLLCENQFPSCFFLKKHAQTEHGAHFSQLDRYGCDLCRGKFLKSTDQFTINMSNAASNDPDGVYNSAGLTSGCSPPPLRITNVRTLHTETSSSSSSSLLLTELVGGF